MLTGNHLWYASNTGAGVPLYDWYVDSVDGSDSNTGTSPNDAFETLTKLSTVLQAEESAGLKRGSTWLEKLPIPLGCTIASYGTGERPIIDCRDPISAGAWSKSGGLTNVYQASITFDTGIADSPEVHVWENGVPYLKVANTTTCDSTPGSYYIANSTSSPQTVYIHSFGSTDPISDGKTRLHSKRSLAIGGTDTHNSTVIGIHTIGNLRGDGSIVVGEDSMLRDCLIEWGSKHNALVADGSQVIDCTFYDTLYSGASTALVVNSDTPTGKGVIISGCYFEQRTNFNHYGNASPVNGHNNVSGSFGTILISQCTFENYPVASCVMNHCTLAQFTDCDWINALYGMKCVPDVLTYVLRGSSTSNLASMRMVNSDIVGTGGILRFENHTFIPQNSSSSIGYISLAQADTTVDLINCTFDMSAVVTSTRYWIYTGNATASPSWNGCRFIGDLGVGGLWVYLLTIPTTWSADNNQYDTPNARWRIGGNTYNDLASYQTAASPREANSITI